MASNKMKLEDNSKKVKYKMASVLLKSVKACTLTVLSSAKMNAPVGTGQLRDTLGENVKAAGDEILGQVGSPQLYAPYVEFGTGEFAENGSGRKGGWVYKSPDGKYHRTMGSKPQPFLRPAFRQSKDFIKKKLGDDLSNNFK